MTINILWYNSDMNTLNKNQGIWFSKTRRMFALATVAWAMGILWMNTKENFPHGEQFVLATGKWDDNYIIRNALAQRADAVLNQFITRKGYMVVDTYKVHQIQNTHGNLTVQLGAFSWMWDHCMIVTGKNDNKDVNFIYNSDGVVKNFSRKMSYGDFAEIIGTLESSM